MTTSYSQPDIWMTPFIFDATEIKFTAVTPNGIAVLEQCFGYAARQATIPKSRAADFIQFCRRAGVTFMEGRS